MEKSFEEKGLEFLEEKINKDAKISEVIDAFKEMCKIPMGDTEELQLLFETGASDENTYTIHLVRQTENEEEEEYYQITVDVDYEFEDTEGQLVKDWENFWSFDLDIDFFEQIERSQVFKVLKEKKPIGINIYIDET